jgi:pyruvate, orthophosphate dikinase
VYEFGSGVDSEEILGARGAGLARARDLGLPTPAGFVLAAGSQIEVDAGGGFTPDLQSQLAEAIAKLERELEERLDDTARPLFLSVSHDRPTLFRGRMTIGLAEHTLPALAALVGADNANEIWTTTVRRFAEEIRGIDPSRVAEAGADDPDRLLELIEEASGSPFPRAGADQLREAILARRRGSTRGAAITIHRSVLPVDAADPAPLGVAFTRNPATGAGGLFGGFPVAGDFDPTEGGSSLQRVLARTAPRVLDELAAALPLVEVAYRRICSLSFGVEAGRMTVVDVRPTRGSAMATNKLLVDMVEDHVLAVDEAIGLAPLSAPTGPRRTALAASADQVLGIGFGLGPGAVVAPIAIGPAGIGRLSGTEAPILVLDEADEAAPSDLLPCAGLLIACATAADHPLVAAARRRGIPIVSGVRRLAVSSMLAMATFPTETRREGDALALDGGSGMVAAAGAREIVVSSSFSATEILSWCRDQGGVAIAAEIPAGWTVVTDPEELTAPEIEGPLLIDLGVGRHEDRERLLRRVATLPDGVTVGLRPPSVFPDTLRLPAARWELIVAERAPAVELLAAKLAILAKARPGWINGEVPNALGRQLGTLTSGGSGEEELEQ